MPEISDEELAKYKADSDAKAKLEASNQRLLDESTKNKTRAQDAESKLSEAEKAKNEADGNTKALLETERSENLKLKTQLADNTKLTLREKLRTEVSKHAKDAHDVDMVLKVTDHKDLLKLDEETLSVDGVEEYVTKVRETHKYLFSSKRLDAGDNLPPGGDIDGTKTEDQKYITELRGCNTRQDINAVRKKYGKDVD